MRTRATAVLRRPVPQVYGLVAVLIGSFDPQCRAGPGPVRVDRPGVFSVCRGRGSRRADPAAWAAASRLLRVTAGSRAGPPAARPAPTRRGAPAPGPAPGRAV